MRIGRLTLALLAGLLTLVPSLATAEIPALLNYQVMLTDDADQPLADQAVVMVFTIYDAESGGTALWTETQNPTTNSIGVVSVILGSVTPVSFDFDMPLWLEVKVDGETLSPRRTLTAAPYARHSAVADDSEKLGAIVATEYALREDLFVPGTINDSGNPIDWTMLKNVPAGFADGFDDEALGAGDGHSLDASDGDPTDVVYVTSYGYVVVDTTQTGDTVVRLPRNSISAAEILDEPSVASMQHSSLDTLYDGTYADLASESIYVPAHGYVLVMGTVEVACNHTYGLENPCILAVSSSGASFAGAQSFEVSVAATQPTGNYAKTATVHGLFQALPGTHSFYLLGHALGTPWTAASRQISLVYLPTAGGNVDTVRDLGRDVEDLRSRLEALERRSTE